MFLLLSEEYIDSLLDSYWNLIDFMLLLARLGGPKSVEQGMPATHPMTVP